MNKRITALICLPVLVAGLGLGSGSAFADQPPHPGHPPKPAMPVDVPKNGTAPESAPGCSNANARSGGNECPNLSP